MALLYALSPTYSTWTRKFDWLHSVVAEWSNKLQGSDCDWLNIVGAFEILTRLQSVQQRSDASSMNLDGPWRHPECSWKSSEFKIEHMSDAIAAR